jgi:putative ABC transport system permease protein
VGLRQREIGVRTALGATPDRIRRQFLVSGIRLLTAGSLLGLAGAAASGYAMRSLLFDVPALNPATLVFTEAIIAGVTLAA